MVAEPPATVGAALQAAAACLAQGGISASRREAARLAEGVWGIGAGQVRVKADRPLTGAEWTLLAEAAERRAAGQPLAYVTGSIGFRHLTLTCDRRALIPRPETEGLVGLVLERMPDGVAADICTGSGCVALALAQEGRYDQVIGVDCAVDALELARENAGRTGLVVDWRHGHLLEPLAGQPLDVLVANPPYLTSSEYEALDPAVREWEPRLALESDGDGLTATRALLRDGLDLVRSGGWIALEVDCHRAATVARLAADSGWMEPTVHQDLFDRARFVLARRSLLS